MVTALYMAVMAFMYLFLTYRVILMRIRLKIGIGDGGNHELQKAIRVHGNFSEYVPFVLLIMLMLELSGMPEWLIHGFGIVLIAGRGLHAWGLTSSSVRSPGRTAGSIMTHALLAAGGLLCVWTYLVMTVD